jgi:protein-tyrosine-phosphatase
MEDAPRSTRPHAVLFACGLNSVRSPMAAGLYKQIIGRASYVASAGVRKDELDPFAVAALEEVGIDISRHRPMTFEELEDWEGLNFDLIVTLSPEAHHKAWSDAHHRGRRQYGRRQIRPDRRHPRATIVRLPRGARSVDRADQDPFRLACRRQ